MLNQAMTVYLFEAKNDYMMSSMYQIVLSRCEGVKWSAEVKALKVCSRMKKKYEILNLSLLQIFKITILPSGNFTNKASFSLVSHILFN